MRLGKKLKAGLRTGAKIGLGVLGTAGVIAGGYLGMKSSNTSSMPSVMPTPSVVPSIGEIPSPEPIPAPRPVSQTRRDIDELKGKLSESTPTFRTAGQRASAIQSTDDFIAKYSKFYPDTRP